MPSDSSLTTWLLTEFPPGIRLLLAILLFVGITVTVVAIAHPRIVALANGAPWPPPAQSDPPPHDPSDYGPYESPPPSDLAGRLMGITATAFVFLLAFTLSSFWSNAQDARSAFQQEVADHAAAVAAAQQLPAGETRDRVLASLDSYAQSVVETEWPLLEEADTQAALAAHRKASATVGRDIVLNPDKQLRSAPSYSVMQSAAEDMINQGTNRINQLPRAEAPGVVGLIFLLALVNLAVAAAFQPARLRTNLFLMGVYAAIIGIMVFMVVETSNAFLGGGAILPEGFSPIS